MTICPVCEHPQADGAACDVCGRALSPPGARAEPGIAPLEGLEPTGHPGVPFAGGRMADLEPTLHAPAPDARAQGLEIEPTLAAPVDVEVSPAPGVERTALEIPGDAPTVVPVLVACRYCRTTAMPGERICARCGMRLPAFEAAAEEASPTVRLCSCGAPVRGSGACPICGARR